MTVTKCWYPLPILKMLQGQGTLFNPFMDLAQYNLHIPLNSFDIQEQVKLEYNIICWLTCQVFSSQLFYRYPCDIKQPSLTV